MYQFRRLVCIFIVLISCVSFGLCPRADVNHDCYVDLEDFAILASEWLSGNDVDELTDIVWVSINDPGVDLYGNSNPERENFDGEMSVYETTIGQYCDFLNDALNSGGIVISGNKVYAYVPGDKLGDEYLELYPSDPQSFILYTDKTNQFYVRDPNGMNMKGHPIQVTWYGAKAFCDYYGYRLPTEWEWQAVADFDGTYTYGCGNVINLNFANYSNFNPMGLPNQPYTSLIGYFGAFGYGLCDMAGNMPEWTIITMDSVQACIRGGGSNSSASSCEVDYRRMYDKDQYSGFRVCRGNERAVPECVGHTGESAINAILSRFLEYDITREHNSGAAGYVTTQSPPAGTMLPPRETVDITITLGPDPQITWVELDVSGFSGKMSKYEITNEQYCMFLNAALYSGDITITDGIVHGALGTRAVREYDHVYFHTYEKDALSPIVKSTGGSFYVRSRDGLDMSNHPVTQVTWYGANAFCEYYGYRLPTEQEWIDVADYDGSYTYGCGTVINSYRANYHNNNPLSLTQEPYTTPVGYYPAYGYGLCDMAGNVFEWVSTSIIHGGCWSVDNDQYCTVDYSYNLAADATWKDVGFRVCQ